MGDKLEFPHNERMYWEEAQNALAANQLEKALNAVQKVYELDKSPEVIYFYSTVLSLMEEHEIALDVANEHKDYFFISEESSISYVLLLIKNQFYLEAESIINEHISEANSTYNEHWQQVNEELNLHRDEAIKLQEKKNQETKQALSQLEDYSINKQHEIIKKAQDLSLTDLQDVSPRIFIHPMINGMIQRSLLEVLIIKQDHTYYSFNWLNQQRTICPANCTEFENDTVLVEIMNELNLRLEKQPALIEPISTELTHDLLLLYPFIGEVVTDIQYFVNHYISAYASNSSYVDKIEPITAEQIALDEWIDYLNQVSGR